MDQRILKRKGWLAAVLCLVLAFSVTGGLVTGSAWADDQDSPPGQKLTQVSVTTHVDEQGRIDQIVRTYVDEQGRTVEEVVICGLPPDVKVEAAALPERDIQGGITSLAANVPANYWTNGCSPTSAGMMCGYYDRTGYSNMYTGPYGSGLYPLNNVTAWGAPVLYNGAWQAYCPVTASRNGVDGRPTKGHVDDYFGPMGTPGDDPYFGNWTEHSPLDCVADWMGTSQHNNWSNNNGSTSFWYTGVNAKTVDYTACEPGSKDGARGLRQFIEQRGYTVITNYNQRIAGYGGNPAGFTFAEYTAQIDAGRPVIIHVTGHSMLGYGYNTTGNLVYLYDTWDHNQHSMPWGGTYSTAPTRQHESVTVIELASAPVGGDHDVGFYNPDTKRYYLRDNDTGSTHASFKYGGNANNRPVAGDWDNDGDADIGFYNPDTTRYYLRDNDTGSTHASFKYGGNANNRPIAGDWDGDSDDDIGFYNPDTQRYYLRDNDTGSTHASFKYGGNANNRPIAGDWDMDGDDDIGFYNPDTKRYYLRDNDTGATHDSFKYGSNPNNRPIAGDWDGT